MGFFEDYFKLRLVLALVASLLIFIALFVRPFIDGMLGFYVVLIIAAIIVGSAYWFFKT